jgi:O-acetyl-ADP-ribose deacetylase (regulator of RNase III)
VSVEVVTGNLFASGAHTLVNAVNCVGVMGAGLALQFKLQYPGMFARYRVVCRNGNLLPGQLMIDNGDGRNIVNVATKGHWSDKSRLAWVENGIQLLAGYLETNDIPSVAIPKLGCGLGGLQIEDVLPLMGQSLKNLNTRVLVYVSPAEMFRARDLLKI